MKKIKIITAVLLSVALCGCADKDNSSADSTQSVPTVSIGNSSAESEVISNTASSEAESAQKEESTVESAVEAAPESEQPNENESFLTGLAGDRILKSEITTVFTQDGSDCAPEDLTEENFSAVLCGGFVYVAEPSRVSRNSRDNADVYDSANMEFTDMSSEPGKNYKRINIGDEICGLTLAEAQVNFARGSETMTFTMNDGTKKTGAELGLPEIYFTSGSAKFSGELMMTGYISRIPDNGYGLGVGDIVFVPCDGQANFPIMSYRLDGDNGFYHASQMYSLSDLTWQNEFGYMYLGNEYNTTADTSDLPDDGSFVKARVTISNFELSCGLNFINTVKAELISIEAE